MPRGRGDKKGYNLDYSRFSVIDDSDDEEPKQAEMRGGKGGGYAGAGAEFPLPSADDENIPKDLRDAMNIMRYSKLTGDKNAQQKATELAMKAVEDGGPEVRAKFEEAVKLMMEKEGVTEKQAIGAAESSSKLGEEVGGELGGLRGRMQEQLKATQKQLEGLQEQQQRLENLQSPEDFFKFLHESGFSPEDMQRALTDEEFGKELLEKKFREDQANAQVLSEDVMKQVEALSTDLQGVLSSDDVPDSSSSRSATAEKGRSGRKEAAAVPLAEGTSEGSRNSCGFVPERPFPGEEVTEIPNHRVQIVGGESPGSAKELVVVVELPGITGMAGVQLDVAESTLRLHTTTEPRYSLSVGPFAFRVDPEQAKAKFSKKKEELTVRLAPAA